MLSPLYVHQWFQKGKSSQNCKHALDKSFILHTGASQPSNGEFLVLNSVYIQVNNSIPLTCTSVATALQTLKIYCLNDDFQATVHKQMP